MTFCDRRIGDTKASENGIGFCAKGNLTLMILHFILLMLHLMLLHLLMLHLGILVTSSVLCPYFVDAIYPVCNCALVQAAQCVRSLSRKVWGWFTAWKCTLPKLGEPSVKDTLDTLSLQINFQLSEPTIIENFSKTIKETLGTLQILIEPERQP